MAYHTGDNSNENVPGTLLPDTFYLRGGNDTADGGFGDDWIYGGWGNDLLFGGAQDDNLYGQTGRDRLRGGSGEDLLEGGGGADVLDGGSGDDFFISDSVADMNGDRAYGGTGVDTLDLDMTGAERFRFEARDPNEVSNFAGMSFRDIERYYLTGSNRADALIGWLLDDHLYGGRGNDWIDGRSGTDVLDGDNGYDTVFGGDGHDVMEGGSGNDLLHGGAGSDKLGGEADDDRLRGETGDDSISGGPGSDFLSGAAGNDTLKSDGYYEDEGNEYDALNGGAGDDLLSIGSGDTANGQAGTDRLEANFAGSTLNETYAIRQESHTFANGARVSGVESLLYQGGSGADAITGGDLEDTLRGGDGDDQLSGGGGYDSIQGGNGNDRLNGGGGDDIFYGGAGNDVLIGGAGDDRFDRASYARESGNDRFLGQAGADTVQIDRVVFATDRLAVDGGVGRDVVQFYLYGEIGAVVDLRDQSRNDALALGVTLTAVEALRGSDRDDSFAGTAATDAFFGMHGNDVLSGRGGDDRLMGGGGSDIVTGGAGADTFDFTDFSRELYGVDTIADFTRGQDRLAFHVADLGSRSASEIDLVGGASPVPAGDGPTFLFDDATDRLWLDEDGSGDAFDPVLLATLAGVNGLSLSDFAFS